ncbi:MAG: triose-phosphate isomerase [Methylophilaceae bacterium]
MRRKLIVGNWKMYGNYASNEVLLEALLSGLRDLRNADYAVCVPHPYLFQAQAALKGSNIGWGGQNMSQFTGGAFTGSVAPQMLTDFGCQYVIIGHSERRGALHETNPMVAGKFAAAVRMGIKPILCLGETREEHDAGLAHEVVERQLSAVLDEVGAENLGKGLLAYEPVWAIGVGRGARPEQAQSIHAYLRKLVAKKNKDVAKEIRILHGGSVKPANAAKLLAMPDIDGGLVGGASLDAADFVPICRIAHSF